MGKIWKIIFALILLVLGSGHIVVMSQEASVVKLKWLGDHPPKLSTGVSWGVPFSEGAIKKSDQFVLTNTQDQQLPVQSWPLAYWPDGSIKWIGLSTVASKGGGSTFNLQSNDAEASSSEEPIVLNNPNELQINNGLIQCVIPKEGSKIIQSLSVNHQEAASAGQLICFAQEGPGVELGNQPTINQFIGKIEKVELEQNGPVRAVVKIEGKHVAKNGTKQWLPFIVRLYFYQGQQAVRMVHTIIYDGDQHEDFIRGLGVFFDVPLNETWYNRHVRFSGEDGRLWDEPVQPLKGRRPFIHNQENLYEKQLRGERIPEIDALDKGNQFLVKHWASWNDFQLVQHNAEGFRVKKRTNDQSAWIDAGAGGRSNGLAFVGDVSGGLAICMRDFWQSFPSSLEVRDATTDQAELRAWLWSPEAEAMDMRHYDTLQWGHNLNASYEDVQPGHSTPTGVGRTTELVLFASSDVPSYETLSDLAEQVNNPPLLTATPEYIHQTSVFGVWSLPDRSTKGKLWIENQLDNAFEYYQLEVEQRHWYGFWDYGDVMHAYDSDRHVWMYDIGGFAWDNTELMPNMWLWYSYLRSGREDIFRTAEAMTRHTGEVDVYHLGEFEGLGSRHNVRHWGCGAKEVRIAQAALGRFYYYLTTDERTGDLMQASVEASNRAIGNLDPLRLILDKSEYPTHARFGPDWLALVGNWMTAWERTGNDQYKERILTGVKSLDKMPYGFFSGKGAAMGYDPETYKLYQLHPQDIGYSHLSVLMGGPEIAFELTNLIDNSTWDKRWMQFCKLYAQPVDSVEKAFGVEVKLGDPAPWYSRLPAYYAKRTGNQDYAKMAWEMFFNADSKWGVTSFKMEKFTGIQSLEPIYEVKGVSTNNTAQWCLNAIELLELIGDQLPEDNPRVQDAK
ncbi:exo-rhamnogalacturonan lyase family protein [Sunxiuqinia indica]|uniref:exo-rhamnogalacturonan lyase family protein n=1 Tax=Sunxiuqinia indica TaxID=2692584 RepID=UPI00135CC26E|nr:hypothetical protein [Sunxiuqinia indica]